MTSLLLQHSDDLFLKNKITGEEKWDFYYNVQCKMRCIDEDESLQPTLKEELHERKFCCMYDGITGNLVVLHNNARPHSVRITLEKELDLGWFDHIHHTLQKVISIFLVLYKMV